MELLAIFLCHPHGTVRGYLQLFSQAIYLKISICPSLITVAHQISQRTGRIFLLCQKPLFIYLINILCIFLQTTRKSRHVIKYYPTFKYFYIPSIYQRHMFRCKLSNIPYYLRAHSCNTRNHRNTCFSNISHQSINRGLKYNFIPIYLTALLQVHLSVNHWYHHVPIAAYLAGISVKVETRRGNQ